MAARRGGSGSGRFPPLPAASRRFAILEANYPVRFHHQVGQVVRSDELGALYLKLLLSDPTGHAARRSDIKGHFMLEHFAHKG